MLLQKLLKESAQYLQEYQGSGVRFTNDYSGRGMYQRQCVGITGSPSECAEAITRTVCQLRAKFKTVQMGSSEEEQDQIFEEAVASLLDPRSDSMGRGIIQYWPELPPLEELDEEEV